MFEGLLILLVAVVVMLCTCLHAHPLITITIFLIKLPVVNGIDSSLEKRKECQVSVVLRCLFTVPFKDIAVRNTFNWCITVLHEYIMITYQAFMEPPKYCWE